MKRTFLTAALLSVFLLGACGDPRFGTTTGGGEGGTGATTMTGGSAGEAGMAGAAGQGGQGGSAGGGGSAGQGGQGGEPVTADTLLDALRADLQKTLQDQSTKDGWPAPVKGGYLFVNTDPKLDKIAGDYDSWKPSDLTKDKGFSWIVLPVPAGTRYKFTNLTDYVPDPWARSYTYDNFGEMSLVHPPPLSFTHLDRYFGVADAKLEPRTIRVLVPQKPATHVLYTHDGQNLFDPDAFFGGWKIQDTVPDAMMVVGIDNTPARIDEYTHVTDVIDGSGQSIGGLGDAYADFLEGAVRPLVASHYGEPKVIGTMGSSLGGLISFHIADHLPGQYAFAASLSGTMGWGSIGTNTHNETMIERYKKHGHQSTVLYLDSGGDGGPCGDTDMDGVEDDLDSGDNYCENAQMRGVLLGAGYKEGTDLTYVWDQGAQHNEAEWASRVSVPMQIFAGL